MADTKVSDLNSITVADNNDVLYIVDTSSSASKKITYGNLLSGVNSNITTLTNDVNTYTTAVLELSGQFIDTNINLGPLRTNVNIISTIQLGLSAELDEVSDDLEAAYANVDYLSGVIDTNTTNIGTNTVTIANIRTLSGFTGSVSTTTTLTATHFVPIIINGASYNLLLNQ